MIIDLIATTLANSRVDDLGLDLIHPTTINLSLDFTRERIYSSVGLQARIDDNSLEIKSGDWIVTDIKNFFDSRGSYAPVLDTTPFWKVSHATTLDLTFTGSYFTPDTKVEITGQTVNSVSFISVHEISVNVTSNTTDGLYDIKIINRVGSLVIPNAFEVKLATWLDLRLGGDSFTDGNAAGNDIRYTAGMSMTRDANGMYFSGSTPWSSWVKFESEGFTRSSNSTVSWIFNQPSANMMIGIGSTASNETATDQYRQMEVEAYFSRDCMEIMEL